MRTITEDVYVVQPYDPNVPGCCVYMVDTKSEYGLVLIDVGLDIEYIKVIEEDGFELKDIRHCLITHGHIDHYGAAGKLREYSKDIQFYAHELDAIDGTLKIRDPITLNMYSNYDYEPVIVSRKITVDNEILKFGNIDFRCIHIPGHTPGSVGYLLEKGGKRILFGGDLPGIALNVRGGNLDAYLKSMQKLIELEIDISCEGHEKLIQPVEKVARFLKGYMIFNENLNQLVLENPTDKEALSKLISTTYELEFYENTLDFCNYMLEIDPEDNNTREMLAKAQEHDPPKIDWIKGLIAQNAEYRK